MCAILAYNAVDYQWRSYLFTWFGAVEAFGQEKCEQYQSDAVDACGYKAKMLDFLAPLAFTDWPFGEKPDPLKVAIATLLLSFYVTRLFRDVYAAAVDTIFVCCVRAEDQPICYRYKKADLQDTVMAGSSKNLLLVSK